MYVEYSANNSGGNWWLNDAQWKALEAGGWKVNWASQEFLYEDGQNVREEDGTPKLVPIGEGNSLLGTSFAKLDANNEYRYLGALAKYAYRVGLSLREAADEWEKLTGASSTDAGCACCGQPHTFTEYDDAGNYVKSGPDTSYEASW